jgi:hypothetical protein
MCTPALLRASCFVCQDGGAVAPIRMLHLQTALSIEAHARHNMLTLTLRVQMVMSTASHALTTTALVAAGVTGAAIYCKRNGAAPRAAVVHVSSEACVSV